MARTFRLLRHNAVDEVKGCATELVRITGMPWWKAMNIARWRAKRGLSLKIRKVVDEQRA